jgi:Tfp pilus assembly protein PilF
MLVEKKPMTYVSAASRLAILGLFCLACKGKETPAAEQTPSAAAAADTSSAAVMAHGLDLLYKKGDPIAAADAFQIVLNTNPTHYGANYQLAVALDRSGEPTQARPQWEQVLKMAQAISDTATIATAKTRLAAPDTVGEAGMMVRGLNMLYTKNDATGAADEFSKILAKKPNHYGANYQLAVALDKEGKAAEAKTQWQKVLKAATAINDQATIATANKQLGNTR